MQQFQKLPQNYIGSQQSKAKKKQCQSQKLQHLWQRLQDLSQVQDESRNQQMPVFLDDNSIMSKQQLNNSFFNTTKILHEDNHKVNENMANKQQNIKTNNTNENSSEYSTYNEKLYPNKKSLTSLSSQEYCQKSNKYLSQTFNPNKNRLDQIYVDNQTCPGKKEQQTSETANNLQNDMGIICKQNRVQVYTKSYTIAVKADNPNIATNTQRQQQSITFKTTNKQKQTTSKLKQTNMKLIQDNKKLFQECIKLRKVIIKLQQKPLPTTSPIASLQQQSTKPSSLAIQPRQQLHKICQLQNKIKSLQQQNNRLMDELVIMQRQLKQAKLQMQIQVQFLRQQNQSKQNQLRHQLQQQVEKRFLMRIVELQYIVKQKDVQLIDQKDQCNQLQYKLRKLQKQLGEEMQVRNKVERQIRQIRDKQAKVIESQRQTQNTLGKQKPFRTNSIKSISLSCSNTYDKNSLSLSSNQGSLQTLLKDKERKITNMKIVHEAEIKKYKVMISQMQRNMQGSLKQN